jgi:hypothetical protein
MQLNVGSNIQKKKKKKPICRVSVKFRANIWAWKLYMIIFETCINLPNRKVSCAWMCEALKHMFDNKKLKKINKYKTKTIIIFF